MSFRIERARVLGQAAFLTLEALDVTGPDGETFERAVVRHPGAVAVVPVDDDGRVVLVRQYRAPLDRQLLEIPAGICDVDGEPPEETARRELLEEVGAEPRELVALGTFANSPGFSDEETRLFLAVGLAPASTRVPLEHEEAAMSVERLDVDDVEALLANGELADAKTLVGLLLARDRAWGKPRTPR